VFLTNISLYGFPSEMTIQAVQVVIQYSICKVIWLKTGDNILNNMFSA
jgi:hypothetical protein